MNVSASAKEYGCGNASRRFAAILALSAFRARDVRSDALHGRIMERERCKIMISMV